MSMQKRPAPVRAVPGSADQDAGSVAGLQRRLAEDPGNAVALQQLAMHHAGAGRHAEAVALFARAIAAGASAVALAPPYALALSAIGRADDAIRVAAAAQAKKPKDFGLTNLLGVLLNRAGRPQDAVPVFEAAHKLEPRNTAPLQNLGNAYDRLGRSRDAAAAFQAGLRLQPRNAELLRLHGAASRKCGEMDAAIASLERAFAIEPRSQSVLADLVGTRIDRGEFDRGMDAIARARKARPGDAAIDLAEAHIHIRAGRNAEARVLLEQATQAAQPDPQAFLMLSRQHGDGDRETANAVLRRGLERLPSSFLIWDELIDSLTRSRYGDEGAHMQEAYELACRLSDLRRTQPQPEQSRIRGQRTAFRACLDHDRMDATGSVAELAPGWIAAGSVANLHYELGNVASLDDRIRIVEWHRDWGRQASRRIAPVTPLPMPALASGRKLRIGFMSSDLRDHPVSYFALELMELYDRDRFEVFCYSFFEGQRDKVQTHIESQVTAFHWWPRRPTAEVAAGIAADGLDMLFELGGSTGMNKLEVMAYRPARIGVSWLGYPHSAGLEQIDYILTDPYIRPDDPRLLIERPFELPATWVALGRLGFNETAIEPELPEARRGVLTFGTMNNPYKFTRACLDAWAAVLRAVPGSRFLFVRPEGRVPAFVANARAAFATRGVDPDRLEFIGIRGKHLPYYNSIDIALDSLPHVGGTTTCETLWMGVPVVSLVGPGFAERLSYSNLANAGLPEFAVRSIDDYVRTAAALAEDRSRRQMLRQGLRGMIRANPLGQVERFVHDFYAKAEEIIRQ